MFCCCLLFCSDQLLYAVLSLQILDYCVKWKAYFHEKVVEKLADREHLKLQNE
jgi:hypothetical protein